MFGPAHGHNAAGFINLFKKNTDHEYTYICKGNTKWKSSGNLKVLSYDKNLSSEIKEILKERSLVWVHGGYDLRQLLAIQYCKNKNSFMSVNLWGEQVAKLAISNTLKGHLYKYVFNKSDLLHCNWYGVYDLLKTHYKHAEVHPWGLVDSFFEDQGNELSNFSKTFITSLPTEKFKFFYPKSILPVSGQIEVIESCKLLHEKIGSSFVVYLWSGNASDKDMKSQCLNLIKQYGLSDVVKVVEHPYLPFSDIKQIWSKMDCGLQIAKSDQLSTSFLEPQYLLKELIATAIPPYIVYNEKFKLDLNLVSIDVPSLYSAMAEQVAGINKTSAANLNLKKNTVYEQFNFNKNILNFLSTIENKF